MKIAYSEESRAKISARLEELGAPHRLTQIAHFPWLYGALGEVPSNVMFICENPSLAGVSRAHIDTVDGGPPDIGAQWWGGTNNPAAKRCRVALHWVGLKTSPPSVKGGWRCYITNVIKEMNVASTHAAASAGHRTMAQRWAPTLSWELSQIQPKHVFTVGTRADALVKWLVAERHIPRIYPHVVTHYSARIGYAAIIQDMIDVVSSRLSAPSAS